MNDQDVPVRRIAFTWIANACSLTGEEIRNAVSEAGREHRDRPGVMPVKRKRAKSRGMAEKLTGQQAKQGDRSQSLVKALLAGLAAAVLVWLGVEIYGAVLKDDSKQLEQLTEEQPGRSDNVTTGSIDTAQPASSQSN